MIVNITNVPTGTVLVAGKLIWVALETAVKVFAVGVNTPPEEYVLRVTFKPGTTSIETFPGTERLTFAPVSWRLFGTRGSENIVTGVWTPVPHSASTGWNIQIRNRQSMKVELKRRVCFDTPELKLLPGSNFFTTLP